MFGGKKGKVLEQELQTAQEKQAQQMQILSGVAQKKDMFEEQFARVTASRAQMDTDLSEVVNHVKYVKNMAETDGNRAEKFGKNVTETMDEIQAVSGLQQKFLEQVTEQRDKIQEIVESNKHFTTPTKYLTEFSGGFRETEEGILENIGKMKEYAKNMSVLSLNAAIEAGRMGESGKKFIAAAEEVRTFSGQYEQTAYLVEEELKKLEEKNAELEEQMKHLTALLRENNISMSHLMKQSMVCVDEYKGEMKTIDTGRLDELKGMALELSDHEKEIGNRQDCILIQMEEIGKEFMEQKECMDELEKVCKEVVTSVTI
ncbi:MAG: methyl-accepting chemotaxis protein [Roseburia sp.]